MTYPTRQECDEENATPKIGEMKIDRSKLRSIPDSLRSHLFGDSISEGIIAEKLRNQGRQEEEKIEKCC
jgi:hypothetical protein